MNINYPNLEKEIIDKINQASNQKFSSLLDRTQDGDNLLMYVLSGNKSKKISLNNLQLDYLIRTSFISQTNINNQDALIYALINNKKEILNLTTSQFEHLINNTNLKKTHLYYAIKFNELNIAKKISINLFEYYKNNSYQKNYKVYQDQAKYDLDNTLSRY